MLRLMMRRLHRQEEGFTLIELLVVVAIIALLAAFAAPKLYNAIQSAKKVNGQADLQTVTSALDRYNFDKSKYPTTSVGSDLTNGYLKNNFAWKNAYGNPYVYASDGSTYYVLMDMGGLAAGDYTLTCGAATGTFTLGSTGPVIATLAGSFDASSGCTVKTSPGGSFVTSSVQIMTN